MPQNKKNNHAPHGQHQKSLLLSLAILLLVGFLTTSLVSYFVSIKALRQHIVFSSLPLTSDTIYSEIQRDLLRPVFISSLMSHDTFLRDWILDGEKDAAKISKYLKEVKDKYNTYSSFLVSEKTRHYYYGGGILKTVKETEPRDTWYFRVQQMKELYETNVDPDLANQDALTVFVNHKVFDYHDNYIGATGVGLTFDSIATLMETYSRKYQRKIYFTDQKGKIVLRSSGVPRAAWKIDDLPGLERFNHEILSSNGAVLKFKRNGNYVHLNSRFIPELDWHLVVEQSESSMTGHILNALRLNLGLCLIITALVLTITHFSVRAYQKRLDHLLAEEMHLREEGQRQQAELEAKNQELEQALADVKQLSGLLPICAWCHKVRDDQGYWSQIESYIQQHSDAQFSHSICPDCAKKMDSEGPHETT
jgi:C4-dicarboxylate-specific signal transduction histidine kinase